MSALLTGRSSVRGTAICRSHKQERGAAGPGPQSLLARPDAPAPVNRRGALLGGTALGILASVPAADAVGFSKELKKRKIDPADFTPLGDQGLRVYELAEGRGDAVEAGARVVVHFDVTFRGITVVSSRQARTLGGNRTVAEPFEFVVGESVSGRKARSAGTESSGNQLYSGGSGPTPPPALSTAVVGMRKGGKRAVLVPPELSYPKGMMEIPASSSCELVVELLEVL